MSFWGRTFQVFEMRFFKLLKIQAFQAHGTKSSMLLGKPLPSFWEKPFKPLRRWLASVWDEDLYASGAKSFMFLKRSLPSFWSFTLLGRRLSIFFIKAFQASGAKPFKHLERIPLIFLDEFIHISRIKTF